MAELDIAVFLRARYDEREAKATAATQGQFGKWMVDEGKQGVLVDQWINVRVAADTYLDASQTAIQIGMCHGYATECLLRI